MSTENIPVQPLYGAAQWSLVKTLAISVALILGVIVVRSQGKGRQDGEPLRIAHSIPFFGHAFKLSKDKRTFFRSLISKTRGQPFSIYVAGQRHYVFSDLADVAAVHKRENDLGIKGFKSFVYTHIFGFSKQGFETMWEVSKEAHPIDTKWLVQPGPQRAMTQRYFEFVEKHFEELDASIEASPKKAFEGDALKAVIDWEGKATVQTMYGPATLKSHPALLDDFTLVVSKGFKVLLFNVPRMFAKNIYKARDGMIQTFVELGKEINDRDDVSDYFRERFGFINAWGVSPEAVGHDMFRNLFASLINSLPTSYLALLHIIKDEQLHRDLLAELAAAKYDPKSTDTLLKVIPNELPLMRSVWFETLRMHNNLLTVRQVSKDVSISGTQDWALQKGNMISIPAALIHFDEALHARPDEFHPRRFLETSLGGEGENAAKSLKPFGGGSTYCPGRIFGEKQMMGFLARILWTYDVAITEKEWNIPPVMDFDELWKHPHPTLKLTKRRA